MPSIAIDVAVRSLASTVMPPQTADQGGSPQLLAEEAALLLQAVIHAEPVRLAPGPGVPEWVAWESESGPTSARVSQLRGAHDTSGSRAAATQRALQALETWFNTREARLPTQAASSTLPHIADVERPHGQDGAPSDGIHGKTTATATSTKKVPETNFDTAPLDTDTAASPRPSHDAVMSSVDVTCSVMASAIGAHLADTALAPHEVESVLNTLMTVECTDGRRVGARAVMWLCDEIIGSRTTPLPPNGQGELPAGTGARDNLTPADELAPGRHDDGTGVAKAPQPAGRVPRVGRGLWRATVDWVRRWATQWPELGVTPSTRGDDALPVDDVVRAVTRWMEFVCDTELSPSAVAVVLARNVDWDMLSISAPACAVIEMYRDCGPLSVRAAIGEVHALGHMPPSIAHGAVLSPWLTKVCGATSHLAARLIEHAMTEPSASTTKAVLTAADTVPGLDLRSMEVLTAALASQSASARGAIVEELSRLTDFVPPRFAARLAVAWTVMALYYAGCARESKSREDEVEEFVSHWSHAFKRDSALAPMVHWAAHTCGLFTGSAWGPHANIICFYC